MAKAMIPIRELLNRICWDPDYAKNDFMIGYYDRIEDKIMIVPIKQIIFEPKNNFSLCVMEHSGVSHMVPFHRIRQVYRKDKLIWERRH